MRQRADCGRRGDEHAFDSTPKFSALRNFAVARFTGNGLLDGVFNGTGLVETDFFGFEDAALGVALQADGRIVVVGFANTSETTSKMAIARYEGGGTCTYPPPNLAAYPYYQAVAGARIREPRHTRRLSVDGNRPPRPGCMSRSPLRCRSPALHT